MIQVRNLHKSYGDNHVLRGLNFDVARGCVTGLIGRNGSGKSSTIRILTGFNDADEGSVLINDQPISVSTVSSKSLIGYAAENAPSYREQTVTEYLTFVARLRKVAKTHLAVEVQRCINAFALEKVAQQAIGTLSKGYRHRVSLAQCLLGDPPVIILDEPTDGLDPIQKIEARRMIKTLATSKAVLLTTHLLEEIEKLCDHVIAIDDGKVIFSGPIEQAKLAKTSKITISVKLADCDVETPLRLLTELNGFQSGNLDKVDQHVQGRLLYCSHSSVFELLDIISKVIFDAGIRVIELGHESTSSLTSIFET